MVDPGVAAAVVGVVGDEEVAVSSGEGASGNSAPPLGTGRIKRVVVVVRTVGPDSSTVDLVHPTATRQTMIANAIIVVSPRTSGGRCFWDGIAPQADTGSSRALWGDVPRRPETRGFSAAAQQVGLAVEDGKHHISGGRR